jgi:hypothetical protein
LGLVHADFIDVQPAQEIRDTVGVLVEPRAKAIPFPVEEKPDAPTGPRYGAFQDGGI